MSLTLTERRAKAAHFGFEASHVFDGADRYSTEIIRATAGFREFTCVLVGRPALQALVRSLDTCFHRIMDRRADGSGQKPQLEACASGRVARVENGHAHMGNLLVIREAPYADRFRLRARNLPGT